MAVDMPPAGAVLVVAMQINGDIAIVEGANVRSSPVVRKYDFLILS